MQFYPSRLEALIVIAVMAVFLSWAGHDQQQDQVKSAQALAAAKAQARADLKAAQQAERARLAELNQLDAKGKHLVSYDRIAAQGVRP